MPALVLVTAPAGAHPRLRAETLARLTGQGYVLERRLEVAQWADLFEEALTPSLFSAQRIFEVDDGKALGPLPQKYMSRIERAGAESVFLLFSEKSLKPELGEAYSLAESVPYEAAPYWPSERAGWLVRLARAKGWSMESAAGSLLAEWIEDEEELRSELDKLGAAASRKRITVSLVRALSIDDGSRGTLNLLDAISKADVPEMLRSMDTLREDGELNPTLAAVHSRVRRACMVASLGEEAASCLGLTKFQTKIAQAMARLYGPRLLSLWLGELLRLSWRERSGDGEGWEGLEKLLLAVFARSTRFSRK